MADCKDIDAALTNLSSKIDGLGRRLNDLEKKQHSCCDNKDKTPKDTDLSAINKRLAAIDNYINKLDTEIKLITSKVAEIGGFFGEILDSLDGIVEKVFGAITFFTKLFGFFK